MRQIWIGCILLVNAMGSAAVTLGRHSGAAIIGRPLDVRVQALASAGEDLTGQCFGADVFYGDSQVPPSQVRSTAPQVSGADGEGQVRIQVSQAVNEPVVTLYVRAGCTTPFTRRYVLLADPLTEPIPVAPVLPQAGAPARGTAESIPGGDAARSGASASPPPPSMVRRPVAPAESTPVEPRPPRPAPAPIVKRPTEGVRERTPRLQLEPLDLNLAIERDPILKLSMDLLSEPSASEEARAAAGLLWRSINASPEEILRDAQRLAALEAESQALRNGEAQAKATIADLTSRLEQAESGRLLNGVVFALGGALIVALAAWAWLRRRGEGGASQGPAAWWAVGHSSRKPKGGVLAPAATIADLDLDLTLDAGDSAFGEYRPLSGLQNLDSVPPSDGAPPISSKDRRDFAPSLIGASRSVATEELFDIQQQADFFVSLGEDEQAIQVLRNHLADSPEPSALAYLDLLKLYHRLDRRDDYERARMEFNQVFNAGAPRFDQYTDESQGLEAYETAFGRIQALWPEPRVLDVIEKSIFRDPGDAEAEVFDLEAYRELLLLHAIAKDMIKRDVAASIPANDFQHTAVQPLKAAAKPAAAATAMAASAAPVGTATPGPRDTVPVELNFDLLDVVPPVSPRLALDVDLTEISEFSAFEASLPEVLTPVEPTAQPAPPPGVEAQELDNLIDFEVLDFMTPDDPVPPPGADRNS